MSNEVLLYVQTANGGWGFFTTKAVYNPDMYIHAIICVIGLFLAGVCICRMNVLSPKRHKLRVRLHYLLMFVGSLCLSFGPWLFPRSHNVGPLLFLIAVTVGVMLSTVDWRHGAPPSADLHQPEMYCETDSHPMVCAIRGLWRKIQRTAALVLHFLRTP